MKKTVIVIVLTAVIAGAGGFLGGMKYNQSKNTTGNLSASALANMTPEQRQIFMQQRQQNGNSAANGQRGIMRANGNFTAGEIITKDDKSITIKLQDGGSKIIFLSDTTQITKSASGTSQDLATGENVSVTGTTNSDGSVTAQSIQLRPAGSQPPAQTQTSTSPANNQ